MNTAISIRDETAEDISVITEVTAAAFLNAPHTAHTEQFIVTALRRAGALSVSLVAEQAGRVIGHVAASPAKLSDGSAGWYGIGPVSVSPEYQRAGIGSLLMRALLRRLNEMEAVGCLLVGDPHFYQRFGFKNEPDLNYPGIPQEYVMALAFKPHQSAGSVFFHEAFNAQS